MKESIQIIPNGTPVKLTHGNIKGQIVGCCVRGRGPQNTFEYHLSYVCNGEIKYSWVWESEIEIINNKQTTGFRSASNLIDKP